MFEVRQALIRGVNYFGSVQETSGSFRTPSTAPETANLDSTVFVATVLSELAERGVPDADAVAQCASSYLARQEDSARKELVVSTEPVSRLASDEIGEILSSQGTDGSWPAVPHRTVNGYDGSVGDRLTATATCLRLLAGAIPKLSPHPDLEKRFWRDGYFVLKDFLASADIDTLARAHYQVHGTLNVGFYTSWFQPCEARILTDREVRAVVEARLKALFPDYRMIFGTFMSKGCEGETAFPLHQDPTFIDEHKWTPVTFWLPLVDVSEDNGCLLAVQGSHLLSGGPRLPYAAFPYADFADRLRQEYLRPISMRAGDLLIFHPGLIHASPPNVTQNLRIAAAGAMVPAAAQVYFYRCREGENEVVEMFAVDDAFYLGVGGDAALSEASRVAELVLPHQPFEIDRLPRRSDTAEFRAD